VMRTERRYDARTGASYAWLVKASALVNHFYFYCFDDDFGPFFIKFCSYFPVRHEAPSDRVGWKDPPVGRRSGPLKLRAAWPWRHRVGWKAALTTPGRFGTTGRAGSGKPDG